MSGRDELAERIARALYEADDPWHTAFPWPKLAELSAAANYRRIATAILPIIDAEIAAERERCAVIADETDTGFYDARTFTAQKIAKAIRSQP